MNEPLPFDDQDADEATPEDLAEGGRWMLDAISAVDFLRRGDQYGLTLWGAIEEAVRWWVEERVNLIAGVPDPAAAHVALGDPDPLRGTLTQLLAVTSIDEPVHISVALQQAIRRWGTAKSAVHNEGRPWPHVRSSRTFPPEQLPAVEE